MAYFWKIVLNNIEVEPLDSCLDVEKLSPVIIRQNSSYKEGNIYSRPNSANNTKQGLQEFNNNLYQWNDEINTKRKKHSATAM